jgi:selenide,water dikinase
VHALTDVTGFGLAGHLLEVCKGAQLAAAIEWNKVPLLPGVLDLARSGFKTGASTRNWAGYGAMVHLGAHGELEKTLLSDPQTSGGLLVTCAPDAVSVVLEIFRDEGFNRAAVIGEIRSGPATVSVV